MRNLGEAFRPRHSFKDMLISELGGELALIDRLRRPSRNPKVLVGIGDDAAVVCVGELLAVTTDLLVEGDHFSLDYFSPRQVGWKAMESNISDLAAVGAEPRYALVGLTLRPDSSVELVEGIYEGLYASADRCGVEVVGGDTTHGEVLVLAVTLLGEVERRYLHLRSSARPGDRILVSGPLGGSAAGLALLKAKVEGFEGVKRKHLEPKAKIELSRSLRGKVHAMEDVSDGLASEVRNICLASGCGAVIFAELVPVDPEVGEAADLLGFDPLDWALFGGEDFELVYTVPEGVDVPGYEVGRMTDGEGIYLEGKGERRLLTEWGYDHFRRGYDRLQDNRP